jgi:hypothetical protein
MIVSKLTMWTCRHTSDEAGDKNYTIRAFKLLGDEFLNRDLSPSSFAKCPARDDDCKFRHL